MSRDQPYQTSASDRRQVAAAGRAVERREREFTAALLAVMRLPEGRRLIGELLDRSGIHYCNFEPSSKVQWNEGRRNFGLEIEKFAQDADEDLFEEMQREMRAFRRSLQQGPVAARTASAQDGGSDGR